MKADIKDMHVLAYADGFTIWSYKAKEKIENWNDFFDLPETNNNDLVIVTSSVGDNLFHFIKKEKL
jgi:hypothetical protein